MGGGGGRAVSSGLRVILVAEAAEMTSSCGGPRAGSKRVSGDAAPHGVVLGDPERSAAQLTLGSISSPAPQTSCASRDGKARSRDLGGGGRASKRAGWRFLVSVMVVSCTVAARAEQSAHHVFLAADQLLAMCDTSGHSPDNPSPAAMIYLMGVVDSEALAPARFQDPIFCVPDGTGQATLAKIVCQYVQDHTSSGTYTAASVTFLALRSSFPCR